MLNDYLKNVVKSTKVGFSATPIREISNDFIKKHGVPLVLRPTLFSSLYMQQYGRAFPRMCKKQKAEIKDLDWSIKKRDRK